MNTENKEKIENLLFDFIKEMNEWEKYCLQLEEDETIPFAEEEIKQKESLIKIFNKYCTDKERKQGSPNTISYGVEGSYIYDKDDEKIIDIEEKSSNKVIVFTKRTKPLKKDLQYVILKKFGNWLIDSKKRFSTHKGKWENISL